MKIDGAILLGLLAASGTCGIFLWAYLLTMFSSKSTKELASRPTWRNDDRLIVWAKRCADAVWFFVVGHQSIGTRLPRPEDIGSADIVVILIHGTIFGCRDQHPWMNEGSKLYQSLSALSSAHNTVIERFEWSGRNRFSARHRAAIQVRQRIHEIKRLNSSAKIFLIAHSHGGTIAAQALQDPDTTSQVDGFVSLSTPYLHAGLIREQVSASTLSLVKIGGVMLFPVLLVAVAVAMQAAGPVMPALDHALRWTSTVKPGWMFVGLAPLAIVFIAGSSFYAQIKERAFDFIRRACDRPSLAPERLLILRAQGDEASSAIGTMGILSWFSGKLSGLVMQVIGKAESVWSRFTNSSSSGYEMLKGLTSAALLYLTCTVSSVLIVWFIEHNPLRWWNGFLVPFMFMAGIASVMVVMYVFGLFLVVAFALILLQRALSCLSVGWELILAGSNIVVSAEAAPPGEWIVTHLALQDNTDGAIPLRGALRHSVLYDSTPAINLMVQWIRSLL